MNRILSAISVGFVLVTFAPSVGAKGSPDKIIIMGGRLARPIEITDRETLKHFDPWSGQFLDLAKGPVAAPAHQSPPYYEVLFYVKWPGRHTNHDREGLTLIYSILYYPQRNGPGLIYLPGKDDKYHVNMGTIWRENDDGKWHLASSSWDALMRRLNIRQRLAR